MTRARSLLVLAALTASAAPALAQGPTEAERHFEVGIGHFRAERYEEAAAAFRDSYRLDASAATMCNLALTYDSMGDAFRAQAARAYRTCASDDESGEFRGHAERRVEEIERALVLDEPTPEEQAPVIADAQPIEPTEPSPTPAESSQDEPVFLYTAIGTGAAGLVTLVLGIAIAVDAQATLDDLLAQLGPMPRIVRGSPEEARYRSAEDGALASGVLYVLSGVLGVATASMIATQLAVGFGDSETVALILPTPLGVSASVAGRF